MNICKLKYHYTYRITNLINGNIYIGRHSTNNMNDGYFGSGKLIVRSVKKHGKNNFQIEVLDTFNTYEESVKREAEIVDLEFCKRSDTYNIVEGGSNPVMYGDDNPAWKGGVSSMLKGAYDFRGENNPMFGRNHSAESVEKNKLNQRNSRSVFANGKKYNSIRHCSRETGISRDGIVYRCKSNSEKFRNWNFT